MNYELLEQNPLAYIINLLVSLCITIIAYGAFPLVFAKIRNKPITKKAYRGLCYAINAVVMVLFMIITGTISNGAPYFLWTWIFSKQGIKILIAKGCINDNEYIADDVNRLTECKFCGYRDENFFNTCPRCGNHKKKHVSFYDGVNEENSRVVFCRKCGEKLIDGSKFCGKCGVEIIEETSMEWGNIEFCKKCGADITNDIEICHVCGKAKYID